MISEESLRRLIRKGLLEDRDRLRSLGKEVSQLSDDLESEETQKIKNAYQQARILKNLWQSEADINAWKSDVSYIHWGDFNRLISLLSNPRFKDEISTIPYTKTPWIQFDRGEGKERIAGVLIEGHPTFAANADLNSNMWKKTSSIRNQSTGLRKYPAKELPDSVIKWFDHILLHPSEISSQENISFDAKKVLMGTEVGAWPEVLLANWKIKGLVLPNERIEFIEKSLGASVSEYIQALIENGYLKKDINVYNQNGEILFKSKKTNESFIRSLIKEMILENVSDGPEAHILNFYEDLDMPLEELKEVIQALLEGNVENVEEKMDGQNLTFTVRDGKVETFSKGVTWKRLQSPGVKIEDYQEKYSHIPSVRDAFIRSHESLQEAVNQNPSVSERLFQDGKVVIEALTMIPENPNTIVYDSPTIRFVRPYALDPSLGGEYDQRAYQEFVKIAESIKTPVKLGTVPIIELKKILNAEEIAIKLQEKLSELMQRAGVDSSGTVGDVIEGLVKEKLRKKGLPEGVVQKAAIRIGRKNKQALSKKDAERFGPGVWEKIQEIESGPFLDEAIIPLESILQRLATEVFRHAEFVLASNETKSGEDLRGFVKRVKNASANSKLLADPKQTEAIRVALERIGDEEAFEKAVEGIVFRWKGKTRKLTGLFTPINKLRGFFAYGKTPVRFQESKKRGV